MGSLVMRASVDVVRQQVPIGPDVGQTKPVRVTSLPLVNTLAIDLSAVANPDDLNEKNIVVNFVDDSVVADSDPIDALLARDRHAVRWAWRFCEQIDRRADKQLFLTLECGKGFHRAA